MIALKDFIQSTHFDSSIPFRDINEKDYETYFNEALSLARKRLEAFRSDASEPNFSNTFELMENLSAELDAVTGVYFNLLSAHGSDFMHTLAAKFSTELSKFSNDIVLDDVIFSKIKDIHDKIDSLDLNHEQKRLVEKSYRSFVRNGAELSEDKKQELRKIDSEMAGISPKFSENVLKATNAFELWIEKQEDLKGLPESAVTAAKELAISKGKSDQWLFTLQAPSFIPFLSYAENKSLREKIWWAHSKKSYKDEFCNTKNILNLVSLRQRRAQLLGFKTHAEFVLQERMAATPEKVFSFLDRIVDVSKKAAQSELDELKTFAKIDYNVDDLDPWDFAFYQEKLKKKKYEIDDEVLRPYFSLPSVLDGMFVHAKKLFDLEFKEVDDVPTYHEDVKAYKVYESGEYLGLFYTDFFPRETKKPGAWMTNFREQSNFNGESKRPHVAIVCNFTKPTSEAPSLLTLNEVKTLFHEFGHALHSLLSKCQYSSMAGTNVYWDFVELPSQIQENWVTQKEVLSTFAKHYKTGEVIPSELIEKIIESEQFMAGSACLRQANFATLDMTWHTSDSAHIDDVEAFEKNACQNTRLIEPKKGTCSSTAFAHIFAGGYSSGYYSYKWAEVLDADAFELFKEKGLYNKEVAQSFKENILSKGSSQEPMELFKKFRGREPDADALFRRDGLLS